MDQEKSVTLFELAGELLKGDFEPDEINQILADLTNDSGLGVDYLANIIAERTRR